VQAEAGAQRLSPLHFVIKAAMISHFFASLN